jgi:hypothetical protein
MLLDDQPKLLAGELAQPKAIALEPGLDIVAMPKIESAI